MSDLIVENEHGVELARFELTVGDSARSIAFADVRTTAFDDIIVAVTFDEED